MKVHLESDPHPDHLLPDGRSVHTFRRQLFVCSALIFMVALAVFLLGSIGNDWAIVASMGMGLVAFSVLALALAA